MTSESERHAIFATSSTVAITTLTPFRGPPSDGPKLILKAPASSWERGSGTPLWNQETLTKGGVWFPLLSSKWIHTVRVRERAWVCVLVSSWSHATHLVVTTLNPIKSNDPQIHNLDSYICIDRILYSSDLLTTKVTIWSLYSSSVSISQMTRNTCFLVSWEQLLVKMLQSWAQMMFHAALIFSSVPTFVMSAGVCCLHESLDVDSLLNNACA